MDSPTALWSSYHNFLHADELQVNAKDGQLIHDIECLVKHDGHIRVKHESTTHKSKVNSLFMSHVILFLTRIWEKFS